MVINFFNDGRYLNDSVLVLDDWLSNFGLNFLDHFVVVGDNFLHFLNHFTNNRLFNSSENLFNSHFLDFNLNNSLNFLDNLHDLLDFSVNSHNHLDYSVDGNRHFNGNNGGPFDLNDSFDFHDLGDNFVNLDFFGDFDSDLNDLF